MKPAKYAVAVAVALLSATGCSTCSNCFVDDYSTVGGKWQRSDPIHGRVGSSFSDPGPAVAMTTSSDVSAASDSKMPEEVPMDEPTDIYDGSRANAKGATSAAETSFGEAYAPIYIQ